MTEDLLCSLYISQGKGCRLQSRQGPPQPRPNWAPGQGLALDARFGQAIVSSLAEEATCSIWVLWIYQR